MKAFGTLSLARPLGRFVRPLAHDPGDPVFLMPEHLLSPAPQKVWANSPGARAPDASRLPVQMTLQQHPKELSASSTHRQSQVSNARAAQEVLRCLQRTAER